MRLSELTSKPKGRRLSEVLAEEPEQITIKPSTKPLEGTPTSLDETETAEGKPQEGFFKRLAKQFYNVAAAQPYQAISTKSEVGKAAVEGRALENLEKDFLHRAAAGGPVTKSELDFYSRRPGPWKLFQKLAEKGRLQVVEDSEFKRDTAGVMAKAEAEIAQESDISATIEQAATWKDKAADIIGSVAGFTAQLALLKKAFPTMPPAMIWEVQNQATGGTPGKGVISYAALSAPGKALAGVKPTTVAGKIAKGAGVMAGESATLGVLTAAEQKLAGEDVDWKAVAESAALPTALRIPQLVKAGLSKALATKVAKRGISQPVEARSSEKAIPVPTKEGSSILQPEKAIPEPLVEWSKTAKKIRKEEVAPAIKELRSRQAGRASGILSRTLGKTGSAWESIKKSTLGYKDKANIPTVTPPNIPEAQWELYANKILDVYPKENKGVQFKRTDTLKALDQIRKGHIPTNKQFQLLEPIIGKEATGELYQNLSPLMPNRGIGGAVDSTIDLFKFIFSLDVQFFRQTAGTAVRHPVKYVKGGKQALGAYFNAKYADKVQQSIEANPNHADAKKYLNFISSSPYAEERVEWRRSGVSDKLARIGLEKGKAVKTITAPVRGLGKWAQASERSFSVSMNGYLQDLWDLEVQKWANTPNMTPEKLEVLKRNFADVVNSSVKLMRAKTPNGKKLQKGLNYVMFSPGITYARPYQLYAILTKKGYRGYASQLVASNIAKMAAISAVAAAAGKLRDHEPGEESYISGNMNPLSADWAKVRIGNQHIDFTGGDGPFYRTLARMAVAAYIKGKEAATGETTTKVGGEYVPTLGETTLRYFESRETPAVNFAKQVLTGKDFQGKDIGFTTAIGKALTPELLQSIYESLEAEGTLDMLAKMSTIEGAGKMALAGGAAFVSAGTATYPTSAAKQRVNLRNDLAQQVYGKSWDDLRPSEQKLLSLRYRKDFEAADLEVKKERQEKPLDLKKIKAEQKKSATYIKATVAKDVRAALETSGESLELDRSPNNYYLDDAKYNRYKSIVAEELNKHMKKYVDKPQKQQAIAARLGLKLAKMKAFAEVTRD